MKKNCTIIMTLLVLCTLLCVVSSAAGTIPRFTDAAGLLSEAEGEELNQTLDQLSENLQFDIVIVTLDSIDGMDSEDAAWNIYQSYGFGYTERYDGVILLISMAERDWAIVSVGWGQDAIPLGARNAIADRIVPYLSSGDYYSAFLKFAGQCEAFVNSADAAAGGYYGYEEKEPFNVVKTGLLCLSISFVIALIVVGGMKNKLKTVRSQAAASAYICDNSLNITDSRENFLYRSVSKTPRADNTTRSSGGGRTSSYSSSHSGSHGKF